MILSLYHEDEGLHEEEDAHVESIPLLTKEDAYDELILA